MINVLSWVERLLYNLQDSFLSLKFKQEFGLLFFLSYTCIKIIEIKRYSSHLPFISGVLTYIWRSKRPGLSKAWSKTSILLVAAKMTTPSWVLKPEIKKIQGINLKVVLKYMYQQTGGLKISN